MTATVYVACEEQSEEIAWSHYNQAAKLLTSSGLRHRETIILVLSTLGTETFEFPFCVNPWKHIGTLGTDDWMYIRSPSNHLHDIKGNVPMSRPLDI